MAGLRLRRPRTALSLGLTWIAGLALLLGSCSEPPVFPPRTKVGLVPEAFTTHPVPSPADAATYVGDYVRALGLGGVSVDRVLSVQDVHWVYVTEAKTGRPAFALTVQADGKITPKTFPTMDPEMMWNQKYGHRARPDLASLVESVSPDKAAEIARRALPPGGGLRPGDGSAYYGYVLYPLCEDNRLVGEAAVNTVDGAVQWKRFPEPPLIWSPSTPTRGFCD
jgi:hypothetical protein